MEKNALQKSLKKLEKTKEQNRKDNSKAGDVKDIKTLEANKVDIEHHDYEDLAYNIPVTSNPFKILEDEKVGNSENNNNIKDSKDKKNSNFSEASKNSHEKEVDKSLEQKKRYMSPEQEKAFLIQFEKILKGHI